MWRIIIADQSDNDFLIELPSEPFTEVINHFNKVITVFSDLHSTVFCSSGIYLVKSYAVTNKKLSIHYHVDNDEEVIRITTIELE